jgi:hypothetical protein
MAMLRTAALSSENEEVGLADVYSQPCRRLSYEMRGGPTQLKIRELLAV